MTGLYIHIPFCQRKCLYCDFPSYEGLYHLEEQYVDALLQEMSHYKGTCVDTVYIGGGTPSSLSERSLCSILNQIHSDFHLMSDTEFTTEVNPASAIRSKLKVLKDGGVNRLSVGIQSLSDRELIALGRLHTKKEALTTLSLAREIGLSNLSVDIMLAIPHQTFDTLNETLDFIIRFYPEHISAYSLIIEPDTPFYSMELALPDENTERALYWHAFDRLESAGYQNYEISNFSLKDKESRHNLKYWSGEEYIGIGAGAHSFLGSVRFSHTSDITKYLKSPMERENTEHISSAERLKEYFLLGLRKREGVIYQNEFPEIIQKHIINGLLELQGTRVRLTRRGIDLANQVCMDFV